MPSIEDYQSLAPFTMDELVAACNAILRDRPNMQVQARTVRFYITNGLLSPPSGGPKFARYSFEHLRRVVAIRRWLDQGLSLEEASERIKLGEHGGEVAVHVRRPAAAPRLEESRMPYAPGRQQEKLVKRISLSRRTVLEVDTDADLQQEFTTAIKALRKKLDEMF